MVQVIDSFLIKPKYLLLHIAWSTWAHTLILLTWQDWSTWWRNFASQWLLMFQLIRLVKVRSVIRVLWTLSIKRWLLVRVDVLILIGLVLLILFEWGPIISMLMLTLIYLPWLLLSILILHLIWLGNRQATKHYLVGFQCIAPSMMMKVRIVTILHRVIILWLKILWL
jgi:hypothetical protein